MGFTGARPRLWSVGALFGAFGALFGALIVSSVAPASATSVIDDPDWTSSPAAGPPGTALEVASALVDCFWLLPDDGDLLTIPGDTVELSVRGASGTVALGVVPVDPESTWRGAVDVPEIGPGTYELLARCIVDSLPDGRRSFDYTPRTFTVTAAVPPVPPDPPPPLPDEPVTPAAPPVRVGGATAVASAQAPALAAGGGSTDWLAVTGSALAGAGAALVALTHPRRCREELDRL